MFLKDDLTNINVVVLLFVLVVSGNYIGELLPCRVQYQLEHNIYLKHLMGVLTLSFFVILTSSRYSTFSNIGKLVVSFLLYIFFLAFAKTHYSVWFCLIILLSIIYVVSLVKEDIKDNKYKIFKNMAPEKQITLLSKINHILSIISLIIVVFGVMIYYMEKKKEYKKKFNFLTFFIGKINCRHNKIYKVI